MAGPLEGFQIIDVSRGIPGRECTRLLADYGADVISVFDPNQYGNSQAGFAQRSPMTPRNKRSMFLNLQAPGALDVFLRLIRNADGVVESNRPGVAKKLGIHYEAVKAINPSVVYCSLSGFGQTGPYAGIAGHDVSFEAVAGLLPVYDGVPHMPHYRQADQNATAFAAIALLMGLLARSKSGQGQYIDVAFMDVSVTIPPGLPGNEYFRGESPAYQLYETKDGRYLALSILEPPFWQRLCQLMGKDEWVPQSRPEEMLREEMFAYMREFFEQKPLAEWHRILMENDIQYGPVNYTMELLNNDPQVQARDMVLETIDPATGRKRYEPGFALKFAQTPGGRRWGPTPMGEDTKAILGELGYSDQEITRFGERGVTK